MQGFGLASCIVGFGIVRFLIVPTMVTIGASNGFYYPQVLPMTWVVMLCHACLL